MEEQPIDIGVTSGFSRGPYAGLYPKDYTIPKKLSDFQSYLDEQIKALFESGSVDAGTETILDAFIDSGLDACVEDIHYQHAERQRIIQNLIRHWHGDIVDGTEKIIDFQRELISVERELEQVQAKMKEPEELNQHSSGLEKPTNRHESEVTENASE